MGKLSRTKGAVFERYVASKLREFFPAAVVKRNQQSDQPYDSDVSVSGANHVVDSLWFECQHAARANPLRKLSQAENDSPGDRIPVAVTKSNGCQPTVTLSLEHFLWILVLLPQSGRTGVS